MGQLRLNEQVPTGHSQQPTACAAVPSAGAQPKKNSQYGFHQSAYELGSMSEVDEPRTILPKGLM